MPYVLVWARCKLLSIQVLMIVCILSMYVIVHVAQVARPQESQHIAKSPCHRTPIPPAEDSRIAQDLLADVTSTCHPSLHIARVVHRPLAWTTSMLGRNTTVYRLIRTFSDVPFFIFSY